MIKTNSSYKYLIFFFALIALISFCEISNSADDRANQCATTITNAGGNWEWCSTQPTTQIITIYKVAFCPALPTIPTGTTAIGMTNCSTVFENTAGATVSIVKGIGATPDGTFSIPPYGNYTYAYVELDPAFTYKANLVFTGTDISSKARSSTNIASGAGTGPNCHTNGAIAAGVFYLGDLRGITCTGNTVGVAVNTKATVNSFDDVDAVYAAIGDQGSITGVHIYLIKSNGTLATGTKEAIKDNIGNVAKLIVLIPMTAKVTPDTTSYTLKYNNTRGMDILQLKNGDNNFNLGLSASYFDMLFQVQ